MAPVAVVIVIVIEDILIENLPSASRHRIKTTFRKRLIATGTSGSGTVNGIIGTSTGIASAGGLIFGSIAHHVTPQ